MGQSATRVSAVKAAGLSLTWAAVGLAASAGLYAISGYPHAYPLAIAIMLAAWWGGFGGGLLALVATLGLDYLLGPGFDPLPFWPATKASDVVDVATFVAGGVVTAALAAGAARARRVVAVEMARRADWWDRAAHDLAQPLATLRLQAQLLGRKLKGEQSASQDVLKRVAGIDGTVEQALELLEEMRDSAMLAGGRDLELHREPLEITELVRQCASLAEETTGRTIHVEVSVEAIWGNLDKLRIRRVVGNLLFNALKYSPFGSEVRVSVGVEGSWIVLRVTDKGIGIPKHDIGHLFERFHRGTNVRGKVPGTGLGLAGSRDIIRWHGGTITVESEEGVGSTFVVRLPAMGHEP